MSKLLKIFSALGFTLISFTLFEKLEIKEIVFALIHSTTEVSTEQLLTTEVATTESYSTKDSKVQEYYPQIIKNEYNITIKTTDDKGESSDIIDGNSSPVVTVTSTTEEPTKSTKADKKSKDETKKGKKRKNKDKSSATTTESFKVDDPGTTTEMDEPLEFAEDNDTSQMKKMSCDVKINTPGQLVLLSNDEDEQSGNVYISYNSDSSGNASGNASTASNTVECSVNDIVNQSGLINNQDIKYIDVIPGVYTFNFENCQFGNVDVYVFDDINTLFNNEPQNEINDEVEENNIDIPFQEIIKVTIPEPNYTYRTKVSPQFDFVPNFMFYSDNNVDGTMRVLNEEGNELQLIQLYGNVDDSKQLVGGNFTFETGKQYYIEITSSPNVTLPEYVYYFQVIE